MSQVVEGKTCEQFQPAKEALSYEPFYGKYATTGQSRSFFEEEHEEPSKHKPTAPKSHGPDKGGTGTPNPAPPAHEEPPVGGTGGAAPGH
jgi:hypothetical protein